MTVTKNFNGDALTAVIEGRIDTTTAPALEAALDESFEAIKELILDFSKVEYVSSAGLRVILKAQKTMNAKGSMKLIGVSDSIMEIFDITGFADILTIE